MTNPINSKPTTASVLGIAAVLCFALAVFLVLSLTNHSVTAFVALLTAILPGTYASILGLKRATDNAAEIKQVHDRVNGPLSAHIENTSTSLDAIKATLDSQLDGGKRK